MSNRYAVIDLGTNTFHLLVAEKQTNQEFSELHRQRFFVKLAEDGIETIGAAPLKRGYAAFKTFRIILDKLGVTTVKAIGTAALRTASNGPAFVKTVKEKYNIQIELIDGNREAELIYKGTILAVPFEQQNYLIMDIGGGSVEFIIANHSTILWAQSFPIGVAVLFKQFHHSNPITTLEINDLRVFLNSFLTPLYQALIQFPTTTLVGASGTFDVLEFILAKNQSHKNHAFVDAKDFEPLYQTLIKSTEAERYAMQDVPDTRADMIVVAIILIEFILKKVKINEIIVSNFALKEGVLSELMNP
ncbi:MAG: phosphatase [Saprospiraceae bacterium]